MHLQDTTKDSGQNIQKQPLRPSKDLLDLSLLSRPQAEYLLRSTYPLTPLLTHLVFCSDDEEGRMIFNLWQEYEKETPIAGVFNMVGSSN